MPSLAVVTMVRNAEMWLKKVLPVWQDFADGIIALDDGSTDETPQLLEDAKAQVEEHTGPRAWGAESGPRQRLFEMARASDYDYLFWLDADMIPGRDPKPLVANGIPAVVSFRLFDMWEPRRYREDGYWFGHAHPRPWLIRRPKEDFEPEWKVRGIHCGHLPLNIPLRRHIFAPQDYSLLHYAYSSPELRQAKLEKYLEVVDQLTDMERNHALSIGDDSPWTKPLPFDPEWPLEFSLEPSHE